MSSWVIGVGRRIAPLWFALYKTNNRSHKDSPDERARADAAINVRGSHDGFGRLSRCDVRSAA